MLAASALHPERVRTAGWTVGHGSEESSLKSHLAHFGLPDGRPSIPHTSMETHKEVTAQIFAQIMQHAVKSSAKEVKFLSFQEQETVPKDASNSIVDKFGRFHSVSPLTHLQGLCAPCSFTYRHQQDPTRYLHTCLKEDCGRCHEVHSPEYMRKYKGGVQRFRRQKAKTTQHIMFEGGFLL